jgi:hypothetical protein
MRPGWGVRHPAFADILRSLTPLAAVTTRWAAGTLPLRITAYMPLVELPHELVVSVRCLVTVDDALLMCVNADGTQPWPGGRREPGETFPDTASRDRDRGLATGAEPCGHGLLGKPSSRSPSRRHRLPRPQRRSPLQARRRRPQSSHWRRPRPPRSPTPWLALHRPPRTARARLGRGSTGQARLRGRAALGSPASSTRVLVMLRAELPHDRRFVLPAAFGSRRVMGRGSVRTQRAHIAESGAEPGRTTGEHRGRSGSLHAPTRCAPATDTGAWRHRRGRMLR